MGDARTLSRLWSLVAIALFGLPAAAGVPSDPTALASVTVSPPVKCLQARKPADSSLPRPKVVSTFPAQGAVVRPGKLVVRITFDLPMACGGTFLDAPPLTSPLPDGNRWVVMTPDRRTFRIEGQVDRNGRYGIWMNHDPVRDFLGLSGQSLEPFSLAFSSGSGPPITTVAEALAQDAASGLTPP